MKIYYSYNEDKLMTENEVKKSFEKRKEYIDYLVEFSNKDIKKMLKVKKTVAEIDDISYDDLWHMLKEDSKKEVYEKAFNDYIEYDFLVREF